MALGFADPGTQALIGSGVDPATIEAKVAAAAIHPVALDPNAAQRSQSQAVGIFVAALLYVALAGYGSFVAVGVVAMRRRGRSCSRSCSCWPASAE